MVGGGGRIEPEGLYPTIESATPSTSEILAAQIQPVDCAHLRGLRPVVSRNTCASGLIADFGQQTALNVEPTVTTVVLSRGRRFSHRSVPRVGPDLFPSRFFAAKSQ